MPVIRLHNKTVAKVIEEALELAKNGELQSIAFAGKLKNGDIATGWANAELNHRQELISHLQIDVIMGVVEINLGGE